MHIWAAADGLDDLRRELPIGVGSGVQQLVIVLVRSIRKVMAPKRVDERQPLSRHSGELLTNILSSSARPSPE